MAKKSTKVDTIHEDKPESEYSSATSSGSDVEQSNNPSDSESDSSSVTSSDNGKSTNGHTQNQKSAFRPSAPYKPPAGFKHVKKQPLPPPNTNSILSDLHGKQVFHVTAPAFLPLSKVKEVSLARVLQGEPVLKHDGTKYGIPLDSHKEAEIGQNLFIYDSKSETYYKTATNVPTYHIQEMIGVSELEDEEMLLEAAKKLEKPPRKQPKHLKMRFRPVGSGDGAPETLGSSSESEGEQPTFKVPGGLEKEKERKRKHQQTEADGNQPAALPRKKSKKHSAEEISDKPTPKTEKSKKSSKDRDGKKRKKSEKAA